MMSISYVWPCERARVWGILSARKKKGLRIQTVFECFWTISDISSKLIKIIQNTCAGGCHWFSWVVGNLVIWTRLRRMHLLVHESSLRPRISVLNRQLCLQSGPLFSKESLRRYHGPVIHLPLPCCFCLAMPISTFNRSLPLAAGCLCFTREWLSCWLGLHLIKLFVYLYNISCNLSSLSRVGQHHFVWPPPRCFMSPPGKSLGTGTRPGGPSMSDTFQAHPAKTYNQRMSTPWHRSKEGAGDEATKLWCENIWCIWWDWDVIFRMYLRINERNLSFRSSHMFDWIILTCPSPVLSTCSGGFLVSRCVQHQMGAVLSCRLEI